MSDRQEVIGIDLEVTGDKQIAALGTTLTQIFSNLATQIIKVESELSKATGTSNKLFKQQIQDVYNQIELLKNGVKAGDLNGFITKVQESTKFLNDEKQVLKDVNKELENQAKLAEMISKQKAFLAKREDFAALPISNPEANKAELEGMLSRGTQADVLSKEEAILEIKKLQALQNKKNNDLLLDEVKNSELKFEQGKKDLDLMLSRGTQADVLSKKELAAKQKEEEYTKQRLSTLKAQAKAEETLKEENLNKALSAFDKIKQEEEEYTKQRLSTLKAQAKAEETLKEENLNKALAAFDKIKEEEATNQHKINKASIEQNNLNNLSSKYAEDRLGKAKIELQTKRDILAYDLKNGLVQSGSAEYLRRRTDILKDEFSLKQRLNVLNEKEENYNSLMGVHAAKRAIGYSLLFAGIGAVTAATGAMIDNFLKADLSMRTMGAVLDLNMAQSRVLAGAVRNLGEAYGGTLTEIDNVAISLGRAGIATQDIIPATEIVLKMARLTGDTFETSANAIISFQQVFGDTTPIEKLGDKLAYIANVSRLSTHDIGTFSNYALASAKAVGLTEDAVGGLAAAFSNAGVNASTIGTQIRTFSGILTEQTTDVQNFFKGIGVNQQVLAAQIQAGSKTSNTALLEFIKVLKRVDAVKFNEITGSMDKLTANVLNLMRNNEENIDKFVNKLQDGVEGQLGAVEQILESHQVTIEKIWNNILNTGQKGISELEKGLSIASIGASLGEAYNELYTPNMLGTGKSIKPELSPEEVKNLQDKIKYLSDIKTIKENDIKLTEIIKKQQTTTGKEYEELLKQQITLELQNNDIKVKIDEDAKKRQAAATALRKEKLNEEIANASESLGKVAVGSEQWDFLYKKVENLTASLKTLSDTTGGIKVLPLTGFDIKDITADINQLLQQGIQPSEEILKFLESRVDEVITKAIENTNKYFDNNRTKLGENSTELEAVFKKIQDQNASYDDFISLKAKAKDLTDAATAAEVVYTNAVGAAKDEAKTQWENSKEAANSFIGAISVLRTLFNDQSAALDAAADAQKKTNDQAQKLLDIQYRTEQNNTKLTGLNNKQKESEILRQQLKLLESKKLLNNTDIERATKDLNISELKVKIKEAENRELKSGTTETEKAEKLAQKQKENQEKLIDAKTKYNELLDIGNGVDLESKNRLQEKLQVETSLLAIAYDRWQQAKGTADEVRLETEYYNQSNKYLEVNNKLLAKINDEETKRKALNENINSDLNKAIETEQLRLGIKTQSNGAEYETLRLKIEEAKINKSLSESEIQAHERRLEEYRQLHKQKKDLYTLSREYQKELEDMDTAGYNAAKAGLSSLESGMMDFFDITSQGWLNWHSLASNVLSSIYKQLLEQLVIKQMISGIAGGISNMFASTPTINMGSTAGANAAALGIEGTDSMFAAPMSRYNGGYIGYASGGLLTGGSGVRDDLYLGNVNGTQVFAMGGEFITRKDSVNPNTRNTLEYINQTGQVPNGGGSSSANVNVPVSINIENQTGQNISADMLQTMTKQNSNGEYEKVVNIVLKAAVTDPRVRSILKGK